MKKFNRIACIFLSLFAVGIVQAQTKVVVIPMMGGDAINLKNVITVAKANGDFTNPIDAIDSIPTTGDESPNFTNRYLIVIGPGIYPIGLNQIIMREWVSIQGSGQEATLISGAVSTTAWDKNSAIVVGEDNAALSGLTIQNTGGSTTTIGIWMNQKSPRIENVTFTLPSTSGSTGAVIIGNTANPASPLLTNVATTGYIGIASSV